MGSYYTVTMRTHWFDTIIEIIEEYTTTLDNYDEIEHCVNLIHLLEEEINKSKEEQYGDIQERFGGL